MEYTRCFCSEKELEQLLFIHHVGLCTGWQIRCRVWGKGSAGSRSLL